MPVTTSRNSSSSTDMAEPRPKFQFTKELPKMWIEIRSADFGGVAPNRTNSHHRGRRADETKLHEDSQA